MAAPARRRTARKKPSRAKRVVRKETMRRMRARWKRRIRNARKTYHNIKQAPAKVRESARKAGAARANAAGKQARSAAKPKPAVRPVPVQSAATATPPGRGEAARTAAGWVAAGSAIAVSPAFLPYGATYPVLAGASFAAAGVAAYASERRWGTSNHTTRETRRALKVQARAAGCTSACMVSTRAAKDCRCPCGGTTHGSARAA